MKKLWFHLTTAWQSILVTTIATLVILVILFFKLGSLPNGAHASEVMIYNENPSITSIVQQPVNAPYFITRNLVRKVIPRHNLEVSRAVSATLGIVCVIAFFCLLSLWYRPKVAILATVLFASASWFLHIARIGLPDILQLLSVALILSWAWLSRNGGRQRKSVLLLASLSLAGLLYVPGMIWIISAAFLWRGKFLVQKLWQFPKMLVVGCIVLGLLLISPLIITVARQPDNLYNIAGISQQITPRKALHNAETLPGYLAVRAPADSRLAVGKAPLLDIFVVFMLVLGLYDVCTSLKLDRSKLTLGLFIIGYTITVLGDTNLLGMLVIPVFLLAAAGIGYLLDEWLSIFPRNPLARGIAMGLVTIAVLFAASYNITNYFIAWPHAQLTKSTFNHRL